MARAPVPAGDEVERVRAALQSLKFYVLLVGLPALGVMAVLQAGRDLRAPSAPPAAAGEAAAAAAAGAAYSPVLVLLLQLAVIVVAARVVGVLFRRLGQPQVVGEMVAGIVLGPSVLGWLAPEMSAALFPAASLPVLGAIAQVGLLVFMFLVGLELQPSLLRGHSHSAVLTSHVSIVAPFFLGSLLALLLYPRLSDDSVEFAGFALFMGAAMSITAFPVLARILSERNLTRTRLGAITLACAAVDDVTAWCILAGVVVLVRASDGALPLWVTLGGSIVFSLFMLFVARRGFAALETRYERAGRVVGQNLLAVILLIPLLSAWTTEWLGVHALFGAFLAGAVMPKGAGFVRDVTEKLEGFTVVLLLPLFFAFTGLRTRIGLVEGWEMWGFCALIVFVAVLGKFGGSAIAARSSGMRWREAGALGALMNTRGLMELVILNIGLDIGVISPTLFAMMVMMALVTTGMTSPLLAWIYPERFLRQDREEAERALREAAAAAPAREPLPA